MTGFTKDEQKTMMTLWCMFRSPLMIGVKLIGMDDWTLSLLTNNELLAMLEDTCQGIQVVRTERMAVWKNKDKQSGILRVALFNLDDMEQELSISLEDLEKDISEQEVDILELWEQKADRTVSGVIRCDVPAHGVKVYKINTK